MKKSTYNELFTNRLPLSSNQLLELENLLLVFPFSQNIHQFYLKSLYDNEHYKFEKELKKTAIYSNNRKHLKLFITGSNGYNKFISYNNLTNKSLDSDLIQDSEKKPIDDFVKIEHPDLTSELNASIISEVIHSAISVEVTPEVSHEITPEIESETKELKTELLADEKLSFVEWLKKSNQKTLEVKLERTEFKIKAEALIDEFISKQPKIIAKRDFYSPLNMAKKSVEESQELASETLAKIYTQQGNYSKAIKTYETLILKIPEKMAYFASQINQIKNLPKKQS